MRSSRLNGPNTSTSVAYGIFGRAMRADTSSRPQSTSPRRNGGNRNTSGQTSSARKRRNRPVNVNVCKRLRLWFLDTELVIRISEAGGGDGNLYAGAFRAICGLPWRCIAIPTRTRFFTFLSRTLRFIIDGREIGYEQAASAQADPPYLPGTISRPCTLADNHRSAAIRALRSSLRPAADPSRPARSLGAARPGAGRGGQAACRNYGIEIVGPPLL